MSSDESERLVVRCRGLPWSTTVDEIVNFFTGCEFKDGKESCHLTLTREGRPSGEAYIEMASQEDLDKALEMDKKHMGKRYIEGKFLKINGVFFIKNPDSSGSAIKDAANYFMNFSLLN